MKNRFFLPLTLFAVLLASCAPAAPAVPSADGQTAPVLVEPSTTPFQFVEPLVTDVVVAPTEASDPLPVATSRGPDLHATDPRMVSLASGELQFVEFFRFT